MTGLSKAGFGGAMGRLAVPLMSLVIAPAEAAGIMLPILCGMDAVGLRRFAGSFDWSNLRIILPGAIVGIALGTLCFGLLDQGWLLLPLAPLGVYLGLWMQHRITDSTVYRWANILLFATGCKLIWDGVSRLSTHGVLHG